MAIKPPNWCKDAIPTVRGWEKNGELLVSTRFSPSQIQEWHNANSPAPKPVAAAPSPFVQPTTQEMLTEDNPSDLERMTKIELEALGREYGVELDRRLTKDKLIQQVKALFTN